MSNVNLQALTENLSRAISRLSGGSPYYAEADGLILLEARAEKHPTAIVHNPALCVVLQGAKWTTFGNLRLDYQAGQAMVVRTEIPGFSQVVMGTDGAPYFSVVIEIDLAAMRQVQEVLDTSPGATAPVGAAVAAEQVAFVMNLEDAFLSCVSRMIDTVGDKSAAKVLYPILMRELCFHLLRGPHASLFAEMALSVRNGQSLLAVIRHIRDRFAETLPLHELAELAGLSPSAFHRKFKAMTSMTPLDYQKQLRLIEARRIMIADHASAEAAAFEVGYASPSHFNRDYVRFFLGEFPRRNVNALGMRRA